MLSRTMRVQLLGFIVVTIATLSILAVSYIRIPQQLGVGTYQVSLRLAKAGGLYPEANVTYRGVQIGSVETLRVVQDGVTVSLTLDADVPVPANVRVEVHSMSAVGEQYVNLIPQQRSGSSSSAAPGTVTRAVLTEGDVIPEDRTRLPVSTAELLRNVNQFAESVPQEALSTTVNELHQAFSGSSDDLQRLLDSGMAFADKASSNLKPTIALIDQLVPVLRTQREVSSDIRSYTRDLASFTGQLAASDRDIRQVIQRGRPFARQLDATFADLVGPLPRVLADFATIGNVTSTYRPALEHILSVLPATITQLQSAALASPKQGPPHALLDFKLPVNNPPPCTFGTKHRSPHDTSPAPVPNKYCKVPHNDPRVVRGARNNPCPNDPNRYAATAAGCGLHFERYTVPDAPPPKRSLDGTRSVDPSDDSKRLLSQLIPSSSHGREPGSWQELLKRPVRQSASATTDGG